MKTWEWVLIAGVVLVGAWWLYNQYNTVPTMGTTTGTSTGDSEMGSSAGMGFGAGFGGPSSGTSYNPNVPGGVTLGTGANGQPIVSASGGGVQGVVDNGNGTVTGPGGQVFTKATNNRPQIGRGLSGMIAGAPNPSSGTTTTTSGYHAAPLPTTTPPGYHPAPLPSPVQSAFAWTHTTQASGPVQAAIHPVLNGVQH